MNTAEMHKLTAHFDRYFEQQSALVLHPVCMEPHIDVLLYEPTDKYPFWKLVTMGASDCRMKGRSSLGDRNEYMIFVNRDEDLHDEKVCRWYHLQLMQIAMYPVTSGTLISYGHSMEWEPEEGEEMVGAFLEMPQIIGDTGILRCRLSLMKTAVCLQAVLINRQQTEMLLKIGPEKFSEYLYPDDDSPMHYLSERKRSAAF